MRSCEFEVPTSMDSKVLDSLPIKRPQGTTVVWTRVIQSAHPPHLVSNSAAKMVADLDQSALPMRLLGVSSIAS